MDFAPGLKHTICALFEVHEDSATVQRIVTPLEYPGSNDKVVIRVRQRAHGFEIDENGEAALYASLQGGDVESDLVQRWAQDLSQGTGVDYADETLVASLTDQRLIAPAIFQVACAAQQLFALATSHKERAANDFKERVASVIAEIADSLHLTYQSDVELPFAGSMVADYVIDHPTPLIVIAAASATRLLEAEVIHMQYLYTQQPGFVLAIAESEQAVGRKQFKRANFYTGKTVDFSPPDLKQLLRQQLH